MYSFFSKNQLKIKQYKIGIEFNKIRYKHIKHKIY